MPSAHRVGLPRADYKRKEINHNVEKPILNLVKFDMKDICTASNPGEEPAPSTTSDCGTDTGFIG